MRLRGRGTLGPLVGSLWRASANPGVQAYPGPCAGDNAAEAPTPTTAPTSLGDVVDEDGDEMVIWAEMSTDPEAVDAVEQVKQIMRDPGWTQTAGDQHRVASGGPSKRVHVPTSVRGTS